MPITHGPWPYTSTIAQLSLIGLCQSQTIVNVFHFDAPTATEAAFASDSDRIAWATALAADWRTNVRAGWLAAHTLDYSLTVIRAQVLEVPGQLEHRLSAVDDTTGAPAVGTAASASDDLTTAIVVKWRTAIASRHTRGRTYVGPVPDTATDLGKIIAASAFVGGINTWLTAHDRYLGAGAGVTAGYRHVIYSRPYSAPAGAYTRRVGGLLTVVNATTDYNGTATVVTGHSVDAVLRSQRRREIGVGA